MQTCCASTGTICRIFVAIIAVALAQLGVSPAAAAESMISPDLQTQLDLANPGDLLPVIIVMNEQADLGSLLPAAQVLPTRERREFGVTQLRAAAERTQAALRGYLADELAVGQAADVSSLWIANGILARLTPQAIAGLLDFPEIRTVLWDPPIPPEEAHDTGEIVASSPDVRRDPQVELWQLETINAPATWNRGYEGAGIVISVLDSGVDRFHTDLASHIWNNDGEIPDNGLDDDNNGYVDDTWGWNFANNNNNPGPSGDHGTKCAGIAAGDGSGGTRTGVAPLAEIMSCRVESWGQNIEGIQYAIDNGAHVLTMSRSQKWRFSPKPDYDWWRSITDGELLTGIHHANSIGNEGDNVGTDPIPFNIAAPGCCPTPWAHPDQVQAGVSGITSGCGAVDEFDVIANYSSIGPFAWEDIQVNWPEYPWDMRPEYRDYPWSGGMPGLLKPDVIAPGPGTTSLNIGGGYGSFSGTSAATPHVAGGMALILGAHSEATPEEMAMILQSTAIDLGPVGKDVRYGAGKLDCYAAVLLAETMSNFGRVEGTITDAGSGDPVAGVLVEAMETEYSTETGTDGTYSLGLPPGDYTLRFSEFWYEETTTPATIELQTTTIVDVQMTQVEVSALSGRVRDAGTSNPIVAAEVRVLDAPINPVVSGLAGFYLINPIPVGTFQIKASKFGYEPVTTGFDVESGGPNTLDFDLTAAILALDMEVDPGWQAGAPGDDATTGIWIRVDPNGTAAQPEDDHTPVPGVQCWVTGQGSVGGTVGENDVDDGRTTLRTSLMNLTVSPDPIISYWAWYSNDQGSAVDDEWVVQISNDGGENWVDLVRSGESAAFWQLYEHRVVDHLSVTTEMMVQFVASDLGSGSIVEAAIDDFQVFGGPGTVGVDAATLPDGRHLVLAGNFPNPTNPSTGIHFSLAQSAPVQLRVFDVSGRQVRALLTGQTRVAGEHVVSWDGRNTQGVLVEPGVYYYRLETVGETATRSLVVVR